MTILLNRVEEILSANTTAADAILDHLVHQNHAEGRQPKKIIRICGMEQTFEFRKRIGKTFGDRVHVTFREKAIHNDVK